MCNISRFAGVITNEQNKGNPFKDSYPPKWRVYINVLRTGGFYELQSAYRAGGGIARSGADG
jgi:hypothetical protein